MPCPRVLRSNAARLSIRPAIAEPGLRQCWRCVVICNGVSPIRSSALGSQLPAERLVPVVSNRIKSCQRADEPQDAASMRTSEDDVAWLADPSNKACRARARRSVQRMPSARPYSAERELHAHRRVFFLDGKGVRRICAERRHSELAPDLNELE